MKHSYSYLRFLIPLVIGIGLLFIPVIGDFHFESAVLISLIGCFWAVARACDDTEHTSDFFDALGVAGYLYLVGVPLFFNALLTGCFSIDGLGFWLIYPLPGVFLGYAIGRLLRKWNVSYRRFIAITILIVIAIGIFLFELFSYPQVYFFNHVWGGWPGPIYDEAVQLSESALFFRSLTVLWTLLLWNIPTIDRDIYSKWIVGFSVVALLIGYTQLAEFGVISPRPHLQQVLDGQQTTSHFELYYDQDQYSEHEINLLAKEHEFYLVQISEALHLPKRDSTDDIESYLYGHPWQKKKLVGAKFTSFVPVWLEQDQLHIAKQQLDNSLRHELVHVVAKEFGNALFNASWSIGLIEGLAVAVDGGSSSTSTIDQIVKSEQPYPTPVELRQTFSPTGFYGGRSGVNYTTSGSFVRFLLQHYGPEDVKQAYRTSNITEAFEADWQALADEWYRYLDSVEVDSVDQQVARRIFSVPSLFEQECPHVVSDFAQSHDQYRFYLTEGDTVEALSYLDRALVASDSLAPVKAEWSYQNLMQNNLEEVQQAASLKDTTVDLQLLYADAFAMDEKWTKAKQHLKKGLQLFSQEPDSLLRPALDTRINREQWQIYRAMTYQNTLPDSLIFAKSLYRTKIRSLRKAIDKERWQKVRNYVMQLVELPLKQRYFDDYQKAIHQLGFVGYHELATQLLQKVETLPLRKRYRERLQDEREWLKFLVQDK